MIEVSVVIPVYKSALTASEVKSFKQCINILDSHSILLAGPTGLDLSIYESLTGKRLQFISFDEKYFKSITGYSRLLLSNKFYKKFTDYKYILIYQLDAWVFRDELLYWCQQNYDYIGAPWLDSPPITSEKKTFINISKFLKNKVGNGGLSLRKVESHIRWAWWLSFVFKITLKNEDILWTLLAPLKKPKPLKALHFAFELNPVKSYQLTNNQLPFGCHAWEKYEPEFWQNFI